MNKVYEMIKELKDVDEMFDLLISNAYILGQFGMNVPVEESREIFEIIKRKLSHAKETGELQ